MKKTLTNLLSFSLFVLLSSFSLFANSADFMVFGSGLATQSGSKYQCFKGQIRIVTTTNWDGGSPALNGCGVSIPSTPARWYSAPDSAYGFYIGRVGTCPTNTTQQSNGLCSPNSGYSSINTNPTSNNGAGSWSVVPAGQECSSTSFSYNPATGICDPVTANTQCPADKPYLRYSQSSNSYYCHATDVSGDGSDIGLLATLSGLSLVALTGAYTSLAACFATLVCGAGLVLSFAGAALVGFDFATGDTPPTPSTKSGALTVVLAPTNPAPENDVLKVLPSGAIIPPANSTPTSNTHVVSYSSDGVTHNIDTQNSTSSYTRSDAIGGTSSGILMATPTGSVSVKTASSSSLGTAGGQPVKKITTQSGSITSSNINPQIPTSTQYQNESTGDITYVAPVLDGGGTGQTGNGTGDCSTYGCATESTLRQVRDELQNTRYDEAGQVQDDLQDMADGGLNEASDRIAAMLQTAIDDAGLNSLFDDVVNRLPIKSIIATNSASCSFSFDYLSKPYELSICNHQETIHAALAFFLFVAMSFGIVGIIFERPNGGE